MMLLFGLLFLSGASAQTEGCIREEYIDYNARDIVEQKTLENPQACAEHCASTEGGLFWTFSINSKTCHVKNEAHNSRRGIMYTVSGNRACGLSTMGGTQDGQLGKSGTLVPVKVVVSQEENGFPPHQCADSNSSTFCAVAPSPAPWLALDLGSRARVDRVEIRNTRNYGNRLRDFEVRVTDSLPPSGEEMFREGVLLGSYVGASVVWQKITIQSPASGPTSEGRYVLLQKDNNHRMEVIEIVAFGDKTTTTTTSETTSPSPSTSPSTSTDTSLLAVVIVSGALIIALLVLLVIGLVKCKKVRDFRRTPIKVDINDTYGTNHAHMSDYTTVEDTNDYYGQ